MYSVTAAQTSLADSRRLVFPCVTMSLDDVAKREEKIIQKARNAIGETEKIRSQTLQMMREWIQKQPHLSTCPTSESLSLFLFLFRLPIMTWRHY